MAAPIVLFTYNRPAHTRLTIESLATNKLSRESDLFVFSDGPRNATDRDAVSAVRDYLSTIQGFKHITIVARERNFGLADSIVDGVTSTIEKYGHVIVLEDDLELSPFFLHYMNDALIRYQDAHRVMHIAGYMLPISSDGLPQSFFLRQSSCWGWATWARAWKYFSRNDATFDGFTKTDIHRFNLDGTIDYWKQAMDNRSGKLKTWAVYWYASVYKRQGLCLHPRSSLVNNTGHDGSGVNCGKETRFTASLLQEPIRDFPEEISECQLAMQRFQETLAGQNPRPSLSRRFAQKITRIFS